MVRTKVHEAEIHGEKYPMIWDISCAMDYGQLVGVDSVNEIQKALQDAMDSLNFTDGIVKITAIEKLAQIIYIALKAGAEVKDVPFDLRVRDVKNAISSDEGVGLVQAFVNCVYQYMPEEGQPEEVGKQMATT